MNDQPTDAGDFYRLRYAAELRALQDKVFAEVFDGYFGQGGWIATADYDRFFGWLELSPGLLVLDVASGWRAPQAARLLASIPAQRPLRVRTPPRAARASAIA